MMYAKPANPNNSLHVKMAVLTATQVKSLRLMLVRTGLPEQIARLEEDSHGGSIFFN